MTPPSASFFLKIPSQSLEFCPNSPTRGWGGGLGNQHVNSNNKRSMSKHLPASEDSPGRQNLPTHKQRCSDMPSNNEERRAPVNLSQGCSRCACFRFFSPSPFHKHSGAVSQLCCQIVSCAICWKRGLCCVTTRTIFSLQCFSCVCMCAYFGPDLDGVRAD